MPTKCYRNEVEKLMSLGEGFTSNQGQLDDMLEGSLDLKASVILILYHNGKDVVQGKSL